MKKTVIFTTIIILITGCKLLAYHKHAESLSVSFGSGGGFTGAVNEYILDGKGILKTVKPFSKDTVILKTIEKKVVKNIFKTLESKELKNISLDLPGNMTNFIRFYDKGKEIKSYQWPQGSDTPKELTELYKLLNNQI